MTIKEIAAKAGVSIATVSHVINHTRYVSPELVDKIEAATNLPKNMAAYAMNN
ncbi:LacI family DNA-binding transcriptional regulator [Clostridium sp.]|uniref:LacI family DNA-binding transcriptional regulator n=1 Tax=Clostridium sp. TaxID=1506 RepID=UPI00338FE09E